MVALLDKVCTALAVVAGTLLLFVTFSICYSIFARATQLPNMIWIVQFSEYSMLWITFLGTAWLLPRDKHISLRIIMIRLSPKATKVFRLFHDILGILLCTAFFYYCIISTWDLYARNIVDVQAIDVPKALVVMVIPLGFLLLTLQFIRRLFEDLGIIEPRQLEDQTEEAEGRIA